VVTDRCMMRILSAAGGMAWPAETWSRQGIPLKLDPDQEHRLYFLLEHYNATGEWGGPPMNGWPCCMLAVSLYSSAIYYNLRGDE